MNANHMTTFLPYDVELFLVTGSRFLQRAFARTSDIKFRVVICTDPEASRHNPKAETQL